MVGMRGCGGRFGKGVGAGETHGVGFDFIGRLESLADQLRILGDGTQSKSYIHVEDVIAAVLLAHQKTEKCFEVYNVATGDYITVNEIAQLALEVTGLTEEKVRFEYTGGDRGWKGDVPGVRLNTGRIKDRGWGAHPTSLHALCGAVRSVLE